MNRRWCEWVHPSAVGLRPCLGTVAGRDEAGTAVSARGYSATRQLLLLLILLNWTSSTRAADSARAVEDHIREEVRSAAKLLRQKEPDAQRTGLLDLTLVADETWEPVAFESALGELIGAVDAEDEELAERAAAAVTGLGWRSDLPDWARAILNRRLREVLRRRSVSARLLACRVFLQMDPLDAEAREVYGNLLTDKQADRRAQARRLLTGFAGPGGSGLADLLAGRLALELDGRDADRRFDAGLALWIVAQASVDALGLSTAEEGLTRGLVSARSVDLVELLDRFLCTLEHSPTQAPGRNMVEALRRITEDQPPETALRAAAALALLAPANSTPSLALPLQRALPGYLSHPSPGVRLAAADLVGRHGLTRLFPTEEESDADFPEALLNPPRTIHLAPPIRQALTNLLDLPTSTVKVRALGRLTADASFVEEHAQAFVDALSAALAADDPGIRRLAMSADLVPVYNQPEAERARERLLHGLSAFDGANAEVAAALCLEPTLTNLNEKAFADAMFDLVRSDSAGARRAAGGVLLHWSGQRGTNNPLNWIGLSSVPRRLETLAEDAYPSVAWFGVAGLLSAALNPDLGPMADSCRRRLENLLAAANPAVRCRLVTMVRGVCPTEAIGSHVFIPSLDRASGNQPVARMLLSELLREPDPLLQEQVIRAFTALRIEPPQAFLADPHPLLRVAADSLPLTLWAVLLRVLAGLDG